MAGKPLAAIVSAGLSRFGKLEGLTSREIFAEAAKEAFEKCPGLDPKKHIEGFFVGQMSDSFEKQAHTAPMLLDWIGLPPVTAMRVENACASSGSALRCGIFAIQSGMFDVVMVGGVEKMTHLPTADITEILAMASDYPFEQWHGISFPGLFALMAVAHMHKYGTTEEQMAAVAVKNHRHGAMNPKAHMQKEITLEDALGSKVICWPLKLYDCSLITDGASCVVITKPELAKKFTQTPVYITGSGQAHDTLGLYQREDLTSLRATKLASREALKMAGVKPKDFDVAEVHDCFTIAEIMAYEDMGFCKPGEGGLMVEEGLTQLGGKMPVNTSGGLKSKGHPVGATGTAQAYEIYLQLTGEAGKRQVPEAELGLTHNIGGSGSSAVVTVYRRGD